jgi:peptide/nickel transport system substrate-binding protein
MPERLARIDPFEQIKEAMDSGPFKFVASERIPGQRVVFEKNQNYIPPPHRQGKLQRQPQAGPH